MPKHLTVTQATLTAAFIWIVGQAVAFVPSISNEQQVLVSAGSLVIAAVFAVVHLVRDFTISKTKITLADLEDGIRTLAKDEASKIPVAQIANDVLSAHGLSNVEQLVKSELNKILLASGLETQKAAAVAEVPAPAAPAV